MIFQTFQESIMESYSTFSFKKSLKKSLLSTKNTLVKKKRLLSSSRTFQLCLASSSDSEKTNLFILERFAMVKIWIEEFLDLKESSSSIQFQDDLIPFYLF